ncbi:MAG: peptidylprolyl isomerase [Chthoniobacterales bacterium]
MINILRKNQKGLWAVIALLCIPFVFYFVQKPDYGAAFHSREFGRVYERPVTLLEFQHNAGLFRLAQQLGMMTYLQGLVANARTEAEAYTDYTFNRLVMQHEAERLGIHPTHAQIVELVKTLAPFRGPNGFDSRKYDEFSQTVLPSMGFNEGQIEELAADQLTMEQLKELVGSGVQVSEAETKENFERAYGKLDVSVVRVRNDDVAGSVQINDDDIAKYFEAHKANFNTDEKRKVAFVTFGLTDEQKKLTGKERVEVLQKLADRANDFNQALLEKGAQFEQVAAKFEAPMKTTGDFTKAAPDPALSGNAQLSTAAFQLTPQEPNSDAVQVSDGFYILHLANVEPARPLTLEEAKPKVVEAIKNERVRELVTTKGAEAARKLREAMQSGAQLSAALQQTGLPSEKIPPFSLAEQPPPAKPAEDGKKPEPAPTPADMMMIKSAVMNLDAGQVSEFVPTATGGIVAVLEKRARSDPAAYEAQKGIMNENVLERAREMAFYDWLRERRLQAGVVEPKAG